MMKTDDEDMCGLAVHDSHGEKIGTVREVWADERTGAPEWIWVDTGFLGMHHSFVPLRSAEVTAGYVAVAIPKQVVDDAPRVHPVGDTMEAVEQDVLRAYYRMEMSR
ncbi:PRC-barrel domain-containing protein [Actinophytocola algeriensis]|uniref:Sporulation protein YlmC with PRC-barrel domain n=1 Tax=Actinophytocola algeriensis TaxID=1768010 RepID=A0A7W7Q2L9_9PSEU|nr:PRC-barrel domain-containing protein [Actinophytocola algeriensis]MBB4905874.1 sporulation protein YlmC with PRC-barrel domain [Actinophytocola algeriensis]MBE1472441.1 sporulation protein YlmC with PRC-barrel domain [Actinophytocola algeriensis]